MLFHSLDFLVFLPLVVWLHYLLPHRFRWAVLLAASYWFYAAWKVEYLLLIMTSTLVDYLAALKMGGFPDRRRRRPYLLGALAVNLGLLGFFKYSSFALDILRQGAEAFSFLRLDTTHWPVLSVLLPIGISFYTFQTIGYSVDVYRGKIRPERHLGIFALYVSFFPQLVAGPIERAGHLLPQFFEKKRFEFHQLSTGFLLILWGLFKKLVVADRIAPSVSPILENPHLFSQWVVVAAPFAFLYQIYCDFSGYTDIARGAALLFGFRLMRNFERPFFSRNMTEFWQRWHISLSSWIRDYVFLPLSRRAKKRTGRLLALLFVAALFGVWHGAGMNYVVFGLIMGVFMVLEQVSKSARRRISRGIRRSWEGLQTRSSWLPGTQGDPLSSFFGHVYLLGALWFCAVFFAPQPVGDGLQVIRAALAPGDALPGRLLPSPFSWQSTVLLGVCLICVEIGESLRARAAGRTGRQASLSGWRYAAVTYALILGILLFGRFSPLPYIYFQF